MKYLFLTLTLLGCSSGSKLAKYVDDGNGYLILEESIKYFCVETEKPSSNTLLCIKDIEFIYLNKNECNSLLPTGVVHGSDSYNCWKK